MGTIKTIQYKGIETKSTASGICGIVVDDTENTKYFVWDKKIIEVMSPYTTGEIEFEPSNKDSRFLHIKKFIPPVPQSIPKPPKNVSSVGTSLSIPTETDKNTLIIRENALTNAVGYYTALVEAYNSTEEPTPVWNTDDIKTIANEFEDWIKRV